MPPGFTILTAYAPVDSEQPRGVVARTIPFAGLDLAQEILVVPHEHEDAAVDARRVVELAVAVPRRERRDGGVESRRVAQAGVAVARREGARHRAAGPRARGAGRRRAIGAGAGSAACSSGMSRRAWLQLELAKWEWMSTPPGMTTIPRASSVGAPAGQARDDAPVLDAHVADLAVDAVRGVVDGAADDPKPHRRAHPSLPCPARERREQRRQRLRRRRAPASGGRSGSGIRPSGSRPAFVDSGDTGVDRDPRGERRLARPRADRITTANASRSCQRVSSKWPPPSPTTRTAPAPPAPARRAPAGRHVPRVAATVAHRHGIARLPGEHRLRAGAIPAGPERAERRARRPVERLRSAR